MKPIILNLDLMQDTHDFIEMMQGYDYNLECNLYEDGAKIYLSGYSVRVEMILGNKSFIVQTLDITVADNKVSIALDKDFTNHSGEGGLQVVISKNDRTRGSWFIRCRIKQSALGKSDDTKSKEDITVSLMEKITEALETKKDLDISINNGNVTKIRSDLDEIIDVEIPKINSSLETIENKKLDKTGILSMANMGQDIKEALTGGSVAVVGKDMVLTENIVDGQVVPEKTSFLQIGKNKVNPSNMLYGGYWLSSTGVQASDSTTNSIAIPLSLLNIGKVTVSSKVTYNNYVLISQGDIKSAYIANASKVRTLALGDSLKSPQTFDLSVATSTDKYLIVRFANSSGNTIHFNYQVENGISETEYLDYGYVLADNIIIPEKTSIETYDKVKLHESLYDISLNVKNSSVQTYRGISIPIGATNGAGYWGVILSNVDYLVGKKMSLEIVIDTNIPIADCYSQGYNVNGVAYNLNSDGTYSIFPKVDTVISNLTSKWCWFKIADKTYSELKYLKIKEVYLIPQDEDMYNSAIFKYSELNYIGEIVNLYVDESNSDTYKRNYTNVIALSNGLLDGTAKKQYNINVLDGNYDLTTMIDYSNIVDQTPYKRGWEIGNYINLYCKNGAKFTCKYSKDDSRMSQANFQAISGLNFACTNNYIENLNIVVQNCRYAIHDDGGQINNTKTTLKNCYIEHLGNDSSINWQSDGGYISGTLGGREVKFENCTLKGKRAYSAHTSSTLLTNSKKSNITFDNCDLETNNNYHAIDVYGITADTSGVVNNCNINNCNVVGTIRNGLNNGNKSFTLNGISNINNVIKKVVEDTTI